MASRSYLYTYSLFRNGTSNSFVVGIDSNGQTVSDAGTDAGGDNPNLIGDVPNDRFDTTFESFPVTYFGAETAGGTGTGGIVGLAGGGGQPSYLLFTDVPHARNDVVTADPAQATPVCFATGTRIRTGRGEVPVEELRVGECAVTADGEHRPIRWIGRRTLDLRSHPRPHEAQPVRVRADAFGEGRPARDLRVSPGHALCDDVLGEVLIPAGSLVDGTSVVREAVERVTYWHVELDGHDLLLAEGLPAESYLDMGNRGFFGQSVVGLHAGPDADPARRTRPATHADFCRPFHADGPLVAVVRARLALRAEASVPRRADRAA